MNTNLYIITKSSYAGLNMIKIPTIYLGNNKFQQVVYYILSFIVTSLYTF